MAPDTLERVPEMQDTPPCQLSNKAGLYYYRSAFLFFKIKNTPV
mgnify:FL=1